MELENRIFFCFFYYVTAPKIHKSIANISWDDMTASQVYNRYRALYSVYYLKTTFNGNTLKLNEIKLIESEELFRLKSIYPDLQPGSVQYFWKSHLLLVQCRDDPICVKSVKFNGKVLSGTEFFGGYLSKVPKSERRFI